MNPSQNLNNIHKISVSVRLHLAMILLLCILTGSVFANAEADKEFAYGVGLYRDGQFERAASRFSEYLTRWQDADRAQIGRAHV